MRVMLTCQRSEFSLPADVHYLNAAFMSPLPRRVEEAGVAGLRRKRDPTRISAEDFFRDSDRARSLFGALVGAPPERIAIVPAVSYGVALAASNLHVQRGQTVVLAEEQFPSNVLAWRSFCRDHGVEAITVKRTRGAQWTERLLDAIGIGTAVVALPHVHWTDGTRFDLEAIGERAREVGAALVVDGTQSVGALPFDVGRIRPDALVCAGYKWLLGPYSLGLAYFGERFDGARPLEEAWLARQGSEDFRGLVEYRDEYRAGMDRLDVGERSNFALMPALCAALELIGEWGVAAIQEYCDALVAPLIAAAQDAGYGVEDDAWRASHLFGLRMPPRLDAVALQSELQGRRIHISLRGSAARVSPHVYNDAGDVAALASALRDSLP